MGLICLACSCFFVKRELRAAQCTFILRFSSAISFKDIYRSPRFYSERQACTYVHFVHAHFSRYLQHTIRHFQCSLDTVISSDLSLLLWFSADADYMRWWYRLLVRCIAKLSELVPVFKFALIAETSSA